MYRKNYTMADKKVFWEKHGIQSDKYYTPVTVAGQLIKTAKCVLSKYSITETIEPSAGNGSFSLHLRKCKAYDIEPEHSSIIKQDFITLTLKYKKGRMFIGNPPFGTSSHLLKKFIAKSAKYGDYIAFICSIGYYKKPLDGFDLLHSEYLNIKYSGIKVKTCFNIYSRSLYKYQYKFVEDFTGIGRVRDKNKCKVWYKYKGYGLDKEPDKFAHDLKICSFGSVGMYTDDVNRWCKVGLVKLKAGIDVKYIKRLIDFGKDDFKLYRGLSKHNFDFILQAIEKKYIAQKNKAA